MKALYSPELGTSGSNFNNSFTHLAFSDELQKLD